MKSGLEGRNNGGGVVGRAVAGGVSMKSGLEGRNNPAIWSMAGANRVRVSMKSGLEGRNNQRYTQSDPMER